MKTRLITTIIILIVSIGLCTFSLFYVESVTDELDDMRLSALEFAEAERLSEAEAVLTNMLEYTKRKSPLLEMLTPHDDLHEMVMQLTDAKVSLTIQDMDDFDKAFALFQENLEHIREHEQLALSNIF